MKDCRYCGKMIPFYGGDTCSECKETCLECGNPRYMHRPVGSGNTVLRCTLEEFILAKIQWGNKIYEKLK